METAVPGMNQELLLLMYICMPVKQISLDYTETGQNDQ